MKKLLGLFSLLFFVLVVKAQPPGVMGGGAGRAQMNVGRFYGKIVDSITNKGIDGASIQLIGSKFDSTTRKRKDTVYGGMITRSRGDFSLENLPVFGQFRLKVTAIGYEVFEQKLSFNLNMANGQRDMSAMMNNVDKDLGNIKLKVDAKSLENVTVASSRAGLTMNIDRKVFNVEKNIVSAGGTAEDVMRTVPSVNVDIDGNLSVRNAAPQIFVDGRPTALTLDQIPADAIASVEVITNPSAKFDASGGNAGIINIVLKKNKRVGYNGSVRAGIDSRWRGNAGGDINVRQGKVNFFAGANFNMRKSISKGETERTSIGANPDTYSFQTNRSVNDGYFAGGRAGLDWLIDNRNTLTFTGNFARGKFDFDEDIFFRTDTLNTAGLSSNSARFSNADRNFRNIGTAVSFKHLFPKPGKEWTIDANYNASTNRNFNFIDNQYFKANGNTLDFSQQQIQEGGGESGFLTLQTDFVNPLNDKSKLEYGARVAIRDVSNKQDNFLKRPNFPDFVPTPSINSDIDSRETVYAAYLTYTGQFKKIGYIAGLRAESSEFKGDLNKLTGTESFGNSYPISLFPSLFLSRKLAKEQELQLNYTRRINRPNFFQLLPFPDFTDSLNISQGNPNLVPEFTNSVEMSYSKDFKKGNSLLISGYFKNTNNLISRYQEIQKNPIGGEDIVVNTYINANKSYNYGVELTSKNKPLSFWEITTNLNFFQSLIDVKIPGFETTNRQFSWFVKLNNSFKLPKNFSIQLSGDYTSKTILPQGGGGGGRGGGGFGPFGGTQVSAQGFIRPIWTVEAAIRKEIGKERKGTISLAVNDIFASRKQNSFAESPFFTQNAWRLRDPQIVRLNFSYRFGKFDVNLFKRKSTKGGGEGGEVIL